MKNENTITTTEIHTMIATIHAKAEAITAEQLARKPEPMPTQGKWTVDTFNYDMATPPRKELVVVGFGKRLAIIDSDHGDGNPYTVPHINAIANARLIAAAPELLEALKLAESLIRTARQYFPKSIKNNDKFELENTGATISKAIYNAKGAI